MGILQRTSDWLRRMEGKHLEHGFGVAGMNCMKQISSDGTACYSGECGRDDWTHLQRLMPQGIGELKW